MPTLLARPSTGGQRRVVSTALPEYQPLNEPLTAEAQLALSRLASAHATSAVSDQIKKAIELLSECAAEVNENVALGQTQLQKQRNRLDKQAERTGSTNDAEKRRLDGVEAALDASKPKAIKMTEQMDESVRKMIDDRHGLEFIKEAMAAAAAGASREAAQRNASQDVQVIDDGEERGEDENQEIPDFTPTEPNVGRTQQATQQQQQSRRLNNPPTAVFKTTLSNKKEKYQSQSLFERYAKDNDYKRFKTEVHEAHYPDGDAPPVAAERSWFKTGQAPRAGETGRGDQTGRDAGDEDDDEEEEEDLAIAREKTSTKCPISLQEFRDPVTSKKCSHSFERQSIEELIDSPVNTLTVRVAGHGRHGVRAIKCPVGGCDHVITKDDLEEDAKIKRRIARIQRAARMAEEEAAENGEGAEEISSNGSDDDGDAMDIDKVGMSHTQRMKEERRSGQVTR